MKTMRVFALVALLSAGAALAGCGDGTVMPVGDVRITALGGQINACVPQQIVLQGLNFLSEHGDQVVVRFDALSGTPFQGGTSSFVEVPGQVISNTAIDFLTPPAVSSVSATITITFPSGQAVSSAVGLAQLVGGNIGAPTANPDSYQTIGNVELVIDAASGVLINDTPGGCVSSPSTKAGRGGGHVDLLTVQDADAMSVQGGNVTVEVDGSFRYDPPVGYEGSDSFSYTMTDGNGTSTTTVTIDVQEMVWFVDDTAPAGGDGRFTSPLDSLIAFNNIQPPSDMGVDETPQQDDYIFVYNGSGATYDGGVRLIQGQKLHGERAGLTILGTQVVAPGATPTITNTIDPTGESETGIDCIILSDDNRVTGLDVDGVTGNGIYGANGANNTIDLVNIRNCDRNGIMLLDPLGSTQIGDAAGMALPSVTIRGCGQNGIQIDAASQSTPVLRASVAGSSVSVVVTDIDDCGEGILCGHVDLLVDRTNIGLAAPVQFNGIEWFNFSDAGCRMSVTDSNIANQDGSEGALDRGIIVYQFGPGLSDIDVTGTTIVAGSPALEVMNYAGFGSPTVDLAVDDCSLKRPTSGYTVMVDGDGPDDTVITAFSAPVVVGTGNTNGLYFQSCTFDADGDLGTAATPVQGGIWTVGTGTASTQRVLGTASFFGEGVNGELAIDTYTARQIGGDPSGLRVEGLINVAVTTSDVDVQSP